MGKVKGKKKKKTTLLKLYIKFFGGKIFTAKRVVFSGRIFLAPSLPEKFHLRNEIGTNWGGRMVGSSDFWARNGRQECRRVILLPSS